MSDIGQKLTIALFSAIIGGAIGLITKLYFFERSSDVRAEEFARETRYEFLRNIYDERKAAYIEIRGALVRAKLRPDNKTISDLNDVLAKLPIITPRFIGNVKLLKIHEEFQERVSRAMDDPKSIRVFLDKEIDKYLCIMDVNLSTIESILLATANDSAREALEKKLYNRFSDDLRFLDRTCFELEYKQQPNVFVID